MEDYFLHGTNAYVLYSMSNNNDFKLYPATKLEEKKIAILSGENCFNPFFKRDYVSATIFSSDSDKYVFDPLRSINIAKEYAILSSKNNSSISNDKLISQFFKSSDENYQLQKQEVNKNNLEELLKTPIILIGTGNLRQPYDNNPLNEVILEDMNILGYSYITKQKPLKSNKIKEISYNKLKKEGFGF